MHPNGSDQNLGTAWGPSNAWQTLEHALAELSDPNSSFDTIYIASGTYLPPPPPSADPWEPEPDPRSATFAVTKRVAIYGGFNAALPESAPGDRTLGAYRTILLGDIEGDDDPEDDKTLADNAYHIMTITASFEEDALILDGLDFIGGAADGDDQAVSFSNFGGAILWMDLAALGYGQLELRNSYFERNRAAYSGGAIFSQIDTTLRDCIFDGNLAIGGVVQGGAVAILGLTSHFVPARLTASGCRFHNNRAIGVGSKAYGGAIFAAGGGVIANCEFRNNVALVNGEPEFFGGSGGALWFEVSFGSGSVRVTNCLFVGNTASFAGGAITASREIVLRSCTIADNTATDFKGGGVFIFGLGSDTDLGNCILWANEGGEGDLIEQQLHMHSAGSFILDNCIVNGVDELGAPDFVNPSAGDYRLAQGSRGVDEGDNDLLDADLADVNDNNDLTESHPWDLDSTKRVRGSSCTVDVGAYETAPSCVADLTGDGQVDGADLAILLGTWGTCSGLCCSDVNADGVIDGADLAIMLGTWGACPGESAMQMMSGSPSDLEQLQMLLGATSVEDLVDALLELDHAVMLTLLQVFLGA